MENCGVVSSGFARKITGGHVGRDIAYRLCVRMKKTEAELSGKQKAPRKVKFHQWSFNTDIVEAVSDPVLQNAFDYTRALRLKDNVTLSTLSAFAHDGARYLGLTSAHSLIGPDGLYNEGEEVRAKNALGRWVAAGSIAGPPVNEPGQGVLDNDDFGFFDAGLINLDPGELQDVAASVADMAVVRPRLHPASLNKLLNQPVWGHGAMSGYVEGVIDTIYASHLSCDGEQIFTDVVISSQDGDGFTQQGDSGLVWRP